MDVVSRGNLAGSRGFSLAELLLAFGLLTISILALGGLSLSAIKASQKSSDVVDASQVAVQQLARVSETAKADPSFWAADHQGTPYTNGTIKVGKTEFSYEIFSQTLQNAVTSQELGNGVAGNRIKKMDIVVTWFGDAEREGYGKRSIRESCLVNESL